MTPTLFIRATPRRGDDRPSEDAFAWDPARCRFALADGAAESDRAGEWAGLLARAWVAGDGFDLAAARLAFAPPAGECLPWYLDARRRVGGRSTLLGVSLAGATWHASAVGDTCLFHVRAGTLARAFPLERAADFGATPALIGSIGGSPAPGRAEGEFRHGDVLYLLTDAVACWFLARHESGHRPWDELDAILAADEADFEAWVDAKRDAREMRNDDATVLAVRA